jgi:Rps23 Pro-64 3,4-dihydroxylase Tpa1-like proline 4-hydroxylase
VSEEPHWIDREQLFEFMASPVEVGHAVLRGVKERFAAPVFRDRLESITGRAPTRVELRSYVYIPGCYVLPHTDHQESIGRQVAFAYYLLPREGFVGGELDLYAARLDGNGEMAAASVAKTIEPEENRIVLFEVSPRSLHRVREVTEGARVSLAGWFLR